MIDAFLVLSAQIAGSPLRRFLKMRSKKRQQYSVPWKIK
jgi:hypothetical protein